MIDLHCHLLPGVDDGPAAMQGSVELASMLAADGVKVVAATPHVRPDHPAVVPAELAGRCEELRRVLAAGGVELEVVPGGELDLARGLEAGDDELRLVSFGQRGDYLLVETPYGGLTSFFEQQLFELQLRGFRLLLAHPERNPTFQEDIGRLSALVSAGVLVQVTAASLVARQRRSPTTRLARALVVRGLAHVLASDAHGPGVTRAPLSEGLLVARELAGAGADRMVTDIPAAILAGRPAPVPPSGTGARPGLFRRRRRR